MVQREQNCLHISKWALSPISSKHFSYCCAQGLLQLWELIHAFSTCLKERAMCTVISAVWGQHKSHLSQFLDPFFFCLEERAKLKSTIWTTCPTYHPVFFQQVFPVFSLCLLLILLTFSKSCYSACGVLPSPFQKLIIQIGCHPCQQNWDTFTYSLLHWKQLWSFWHRSVSLLLLGAIATSVSCRW